MLSWRRRLQLLQFHVYGQQVIYIKNKKQNPEPSAISQHS